MEAKSVLTVDKRRVAVRLSQPNRDPRDGNLLLFASVNGEPRCETILELLNSSRSVIPFILHEDGMVLLLTRLNIGWVAVGAGVPADLVFPPGFEPSHEQRVELRFLDESRVEGVIAWPATRHTARLSDYLSEPPSFIGVATGFGTLLVNKQQVREVCVKER